MDQHDITDNHRRLLDLEPGDNPEWLSYDHNRETVYAIADRVSEFMGEGMSEDEALLCAYADRLAEIENRAAVVKAQADKIIGRQKAMKGALERCFENAVRRRASERMPPKRKTLDTLFGTFRFRSKAQQLKWEDAAAIRWAEENAPRLVVMTPTISDRAEFLREVEACIVGDEKKKLPEGFEWDGGGESFSVTVKAKGGEDE
jgi:hypothetical protein